MTLNVAGRFWLGYILALALLLGSGVSHAGYYASITQTNGGVYWGQLGASSPCMLTVGMAISKVSNVSYAASVVVTALDIEAHTWSAFNANNINLNVMGTYAACDSLPGGAIQPPMPSGVVDPGIVFGGVSGGSGAVTLEEPFDPLKASGLFAFFFSFIVGVWVFTKNLGLILNAVRRW